MQQHSTASAQASQQQMDPIKQLVGGLANNASVTQQQTPDSVLRSEIQNLFKC